MLKLMQKISATCVSLIVSILLLDYYFALLNFNTIFAFLYVIIIFFASIWVTFMFLQSVLSTNTPFKSSSNQLLTNINSPITNININLISDERKSQIAPVDTRIQNFVSDIEQQFIKKWYSAYISTDEQFLNESSKLIDIVVRRFLQIAGQINSDKVLHGTLTILLKHVKEYKRAVKKAKIDQSVEAHYKYGHSGSKSEKAFENFALQIMSKTLRHFVHWELYNSVACRCLNAILARKLVSHAIHLLSAPGFINYKILTAFDHDKKYLKYQSVSISNVDHAEEKVTGNIERVGTPDDVDAIDAVDSKETENKDGTTDSQVLVKSGDEIPEKAEPGKKEEVKVYESRSANKTWRHSSDLDCISLGQDILFLSNIMEEDGKPDWTLLAEKKTATSVSVSVKDTMKDIQQTTSNAMHKIEDEAAGVVEGILDLGRAGIRKGLRLTGLQDNVLEARPKSESKDIPKSNKTRLAKLSHVNSDEDDKYAFPTAFGKKHKEKIEEESFEDVYMIPLHHMHDAKLVEAVSPGYEGDILLERSPVIESKGRLESNNSNESNASRTSQSSSSSKFEIGSIPTMEFLHVEDSPEPEYEDNVDLATTTAKLRSLLAQKTEANTPIASPMSLMPTPQDASGSSVDELSEVDGALPSMYKAWAKTVFQNTLNTIKTALPGSTAEEICPAAGQQVAGLNSTAPQYTNAGDENWHFEEVADGEFSSVLGRFLAERQPFCVVDNAFEAVEAIDFSDQMEGSFILHQHNGKYEEELDDFDTTIPLTKTLVDLICELVEETYPPLVKEYIVKAFLLTCGSSIEEKLQNLSEQLIKSIAYSIGRLPKIDTSQGVMGMKIEELVDPIVDALKDTLGEWLSEDSIKSILTLSLESLQSHKINVDTSLQIMELFISEVITACNQSSPSYSV